MKQSEDQNSELDKNENVIAERLRQQERVPRVSVLMTYYNKGAFVEECLRSVLAQEFQDWELLVVDDGSTDKGLELVRTFSDPRISIIESATNTGRAAAANRGYDRARGEYVAVIDADDRMAPERLAEQVAYMDRHPELGVSSSGYRCFGSLEKVFIDPADDATIRATSLFGLRLQYGACILRRSVIEEHRIRCDQDWHLPGMDYLFLLQIGGHAQYANIEKVLTDYRIGEQNMSYGRDRAADRTALSLETFRYFGYAISDSDLDLHMMLHSIHFKAIGAGRLKDLRSWMKRLSAWNRLKGHFDELLFETELERRWERLFHRTADEDLMAALQHMLLGGAVSFARVSYMTKVAVKRWWYLRRS